MYAKDSREVTPTTGMFLTSANALIVAIPILIPVKDPGPRQQANRLMSLKKDVPLLKLRQS